MKKLHTKTKSVGAGGSWKAIDERFDPTVVKQTTPLSCVAAVGEMLLRQHGIEVSQSEILAKIGQPARIEDLADFLNEVDKPSNSIWKGMFIAEDDWLKLMYKGAWAAALHDKNPLGHLVVIEGFDKKGLLNVKDPFDGTSYKMTEDEFSKYWGLGAVFKWKS